MFYGKECNYAFSVDRDNEFQVCFIKDETKDRNEYIHELGNNHFNNVDTCVLWAAYKLFIDSEWKFRWEKIIISNANAEIEMEIKTQNELVEAMWVTLTDVNVDADEYTEQNWFVFPVGTHKEYIWHWFDEHHSKGVSYLVNEYET